jgi:anti-sigma B factor antagonist
MGMAPPRTSWEQATMSTSLFTVQPIEKFTVIEFQTASMMDPVELEQMGTELRRLVDEEDRRRLILDFERVQYMSSQALGLIMELRKKLAALPHSRLVLCSVCPPLEKLLKITGLNKMLTVKATQKEAVKVWD